MLPTFSAEYLSTFSSILFFSSYGSGFGSGAARGGLGGSKTLDLESLNRLVRDSESGEIGFPFGETMEDCLVGDFLGEGEYGDGDPVIGFRVVWCWFGAGGDRTLELRRGYRCGD